jgi:hypothetical protein
MEILEEALTELGVHVAPGAGAHAAAEAAQNSLDGATEREPVLATIA